MGCGRVCSSRRQGRCGEERASPPAASRRAPRPRAGFAGPSERCRALGLRGDPTVARVGTEPRLDGAMAQQTPVRAAAQRGRSGSCGSSWAHAADGLGPSPDRSGSRGRIWAQGGVHGRIPQQNRASNLDEPAVRPGSMGERAGKKGLRAYHDFTGGAGWEKGAADLPRFYAIVPGLHTRFKKEREILGA